MLDGHTADLIVVLARAPGSTGDGLACRFFTVPGNAPGLERQRAARPWTRRASWRALEFKGVEATLLGEAGAAAAPFANAP